MTECENASCNLKNNMYFFLSDHTHKHVSVP